MPKDDKVAGTPPAPTQNAAIQDASDAEISSLKAELATLRAENANLQKELKASKKPAKLEDMTACVNGRVVRVLRTVEARFALDEVKKGYLDGDLELLVPERS